MTLDYHLRELEIARSNAPQKENPVVPAGCKRLLDIGCGIGQTLEVCCPPGAEAFGIDIDAEAVEYGKKLFPKFDLRVAGGESLPFPDGFFDFIICRVSLPLMDIPKSLKEMNRVLTPGGSVWLTLHDFKMLFSGKDGSWKSAVRVGVAIFNSLLLHVGGKVRFPRVPFETFQTEFSIRYNLRRAGFDHIVIKHDRHFVVSASKK
jgi:ubiquinone/menaquinone biosynthesis C-methylase UbiE